MLEDNMMTTNLQDMVSKLTASAVNPSSVDFSDIESLTVRDLRCLASKQGVQLQTNDEKASIVSVVIWIILAESPEGTQPMQAPHHDFGGRQQQLIA
jgi:hypothetical protein